MRVVVSPCNVTANFYANGSAYFIARLLFTTFSEAYYTKRKRNNANGPNGGGVATRENRYRGESERTPYVYLIPCRHVWQTYEIIKPLGSHAVIRRRIHVTKHRVLHVANRRKYDAGKKKKNNVWVTKHKCFNRLVCNSCFKLFKNWFKFWGKNSDNDSLEKKSCVLWNH